MKIRTLLAISVLALTSVPAAAQAQRRADLQPPQPVQPQLRRVTAPPALSYADPGSLLRDCFDRCVAADARVCADPTSCLTQNIRACQMAAQAIRAGSMILGVADAGRWCERSRPTPSAAPQPTDPSVEPAAPVANRLLAAEAERQQRLRRRERANATCGSGHLREPCLTCLSQSSDNRWVTLDMSPAAINMMVPATGDNAGRSLAEREIQYRCQTHAAAPIAMAVARVSTEVDRVAMQARSTEGQVNQMAITGTVAAPDTLRQLRVILLGMRRLMAQRELDQATNDLRNCTMSHLASRTPAQVDPCAEQRRTLAFVDEFYAPLMRETRGFDVGGLVPYIERITQTIDSCQDATGDRLAACTRAHQRLADAIVRPEVPAGRPSPPARAIAARVPPPVRQDGARVVPPPAPAGTIVYTDLEE